MEPPKYKLLRPDLQETYIQLQRSIKHLEALHHIYHNDLKNAQDQFRDTDADLAYARSELHLFVEKYLGSA